MFTGISAMSENELMEKLTPEQFRQLWSRTYNTDGKPDWSHIFPYYHPDIVFEDSIQRIEGLQEFKAMTERLGRRCKQLTMEIQSVAMKPGEIFFEWKMVMMFNKYPPTPVYGCSRLTLDENNLIIHQRDYFDLWGDIFNGIPYFKKLYRQFLRKHFG